MDDDLIEAQREVDAITPSVPPIAPPPSPYAQIGLDDEITITVRHQKGSRLHVFFTHARQIASPLLPDHDAALLRNDDEGLTWCRGHDIEAARSLIVTAALASTQLLVGDMTRFFFKEANIAWPADLVSIGYDVSKDEFVVLESGVRIARKVVELYGWKVARSPGT